MILVGFMGLLLGVMAGWWLRTLYQRVLGRAITRLRRQLYGTPRRHR